MILVSGYYWIIRLSISSVGVTGNVSIYSLISCGKGKRLNFFVHNMNKKMWSKTSSTVGNKNVMLTINSINLKQLYDKMVLILLSNHDFGQWIWVLFSIKSITNVLKISSNNVSNNLLQNNGKQAAPIAELLCHK